MDGPSTTTVKALAKFKSKSKLDNSSTTTSPQTNDSDPEAETEPAQLTEDDQEIQNELDIIDLGNRAKTKDALEKWKIKKADASLDLTGKAFLDEEIVLIANALSYQDTYHFSSLVLSRCFVGGKELKTIMGGLKMNRCLTSIDLSSTKVDDEGCSCLQYGLANNRNLTFLDVRNCDEVTDMGALSLLSLVLCIKDFEEDADVDALNNKLLKMDLNNFDYDEQEERELNWLSGCAQHKDLCEEGEDYEPDSEDENGVKIQAELHVLLQNSEKGGGKVNYMPTNWQKEIYDKASLSKLLPKLDLVKQVANSIVNTENDNISKSSSSSKSASMMVKHMEEQAAQPRENLDRNLKKFRSLGNFAKMGKSKKKVDEKGKSDEKEQEKDQENGNIPRSGSKKSWGILKSKSKSSWLTRKTDSKKEFAEEKVFHPLAEEDDGDEMADALANQLSNLVNDEKPKKQTSSILKKRSFSKKTKNLEEEEKEKPREKVLSFAPPELSRSAADDEDENVDTNADGAADEDDILAEQLASSMLTDVLTATNDAPKKPNKKGGGLFGSLKAASKFRSSLQKNKEKAAAKKSSNLDKITERRKSVENGTSSKAANPFAPNKTGGKMGGLWRKSLKKIRTHDFVTHATTPLCPNLKTLCGLKVDYILANDSSSLDLNSMGLGSVEALLLAFLLRRMTKLETIDLSHNKFKTSSIKSLGRVMASLPHLTAINFSHNSLYASGGYQAALILASCKGLKRLNLIDVEITNSGEEALAIRKTKFDLNDIHPTLRSAKRLVRNLKNHECLVELELEENEVDDFVLASVGNRLKVNKALVHNQTDFHGYVDTKFYGSGGWNKRKEAVDRRTSIICDETFFERENVNETRVAIVKEKVLEKEEELNQEVEKIVIVEEQKEAEGEEKKTVTVTETETETERSSPSPNSTSRPGSPAAFAANMASGLASSLSTSASSLLKPKKKKKKKKRKKEENELLLDELDENTHKYFLEKIKKIERVEIHTPHSRHNDRRDRAKVGGVGEAGGCKKCVGCITMTKCVNKGHYSRVDEVQDLLRMGMLKGSLKENLQVVRERKRGEERRQSVMKSFNKNN